MGFVYFFEDVKTEDGITRGANFDLSRTERALEEVALFPIGEAYGWTSVKDDVLCRGYDGMKVVGERIRRCMEGSPTETVPFFGYHDLEKRKEKRLTADSAQSGVKDPRSSRSTSRGARSCP